MFSSEVWIDCSDPNEFAPRYFCCNKELSSSVLKSTVIFEFVFKVFRLGDRYTERQNRKQVPLHELIYV